MIRMSVSYPSGEGSTFDLNYYTSSHIPLCERVMKPSRVEVDKGINGPYVAAAHFYFDSMEAFGAAMSSDEMGAVMADVANYSSNCTPVMQISEILD